MQSLASRLAQVMTGVVVAGLAVTGCSGSDSDGPRRLSAPVATSAPTVRPTSQPKQPVDQKTAEAAVVRRYFDTLNGLSARMDASGLAALMTTDCPCRVQVTSVRHEAALHRRYVGTDRINVIRPNIDGRAVGDVVVDFDASRSGLVTADGRRISSTPPGTHLNRDFVMRRVDGMWLIARIDKL